MNDIVDELHEMDLIADAVNREEISYIVTPRQPVVDASGLPSKFDLKDVD